MGMPVPSHLPAGASLKGNWGDIGAKRAAESTALGGFPAGGGGGKTGKYSRMQTPNTSSTEYVTVRKTHNPDRANTTRSS